MVQGKKSEVDGTCIGYDEAGETWKRLQTLCLVSPTVGFGEYLQVDAQVVTRETVSETSILEEIRENLMTHCEEGHDDSEETPLSPSTKEALDMVKQLQLYVMCHKTNGEDFSAILHKMNGYLMKQLLENKKQSTVLDYFRQK